MSLERQFSKELAPEERKKTAEELRETRIKLRNDWDSYSKEEIVELSPELQEAYENARKDFIGRIFQTENFLNKKLFFESLAKEERYKAVSEIQHKFNERMSEILESTPLSPEEQDKYLSEEAVASMSLGDYLVLMKRLSGYFVSHVTRYGVREQSFMSTGGGHTRSGGEFIDNFTGILESGKLNSFFSNILNGTEYARGIIKDLVEYETAQAASEGREVKKDEIVRKSLERLMEAETKNPAHPADKSSIHVAVNDIAARYYGSEIGYDIFFYFPAEVIAKNYWHQESAGGTQLHSGDKGWYNDMTVWNEGKGVPIDTGVLCLPKGTFVDKETGSQYILDENRKPKIILEVAEHIKFYEENQQMFQDALNRLHEEESSHIRENRQHLFFESDSFKQATGDLGFKDTQAFRSYYEFIGSSVSENELANFYQLKARNYYERPGDEHLTTTEDFWENYFKNHPEQKPSKVFYYIYPEGIGHVGKTGKKVSGYEDLFSSKGFGSVEEIPNYQEYLDATKEELALAITNEYDTLYPRSTN